MNQNIKFGYNLSSEEHSPRDLVKNAQRAEKLGFDFVMISDHYHPWMEAQGHAPFVWSVIGAIAQATQRIRLGTGVTCPIMRIHPAILAQAAATTAVMMPGRFFFGVGSGENLNEHILGQHWPQAPVRLEMLEEAIHVMRLLWQGEEINHSGKYYTVEDARLYTVPEEPPQVYVAAAAKKSAQLAGRLGDGLISTSPEEEIVQNFESSGGKGKPRLGKVNACWAPTEKAGRRVVFETWRNSGIAGQLTQEIANTALMEQAASMVTEDMATKDVACGPDPEKLLEQVRTFARAGYDHIYFHQIGPNQDGFFKFFEKKILPALR